MYSRITRVNLPINKNFYHDFIDCIVDGLEFNLKCASD